MPGRLSAQAADSSKAAASANTVTCKDGTTVSRGQGACSHHGGVVARPASAASTNPNKTKSGPDQDQPVTAKGDTLKQGDSTSSSPNR
jgi:hypothetical protein